MVHIYLWSMYIVLTSKWPIHDVYTCGTFRWHINIVKYLCIGLWTPHIHMVRMVGRVHIYGTFVLYLEMGHISMELGWTSK
jgi:hypothetical protein